MRSACWAMWRASWDFEAMTLFNGGVGLMVAACLFKLHALQQR